MNFSKKNHDFKQKIKMMNKQIIKITLSLLLIAASFTSCVDDKDFETPQVVEIDNDISTADFNSIRANILNQYDYNNPAPSQLIYTYPDDSPAIVAGYVVSDDSNGNYYKKLIIQDKPEDPTMGYEISIDQGNLHGIYNPGRKIYIKMAGLSVGYFDGQQGNASTNYENQSKPTDNIPGVYRIGVDNDGSIGRIDHTLFAKNIKKSSVTETIVPKLITDSDFSDANMNIFVSLDNIQFDINDLDKTFAGELGDAYDATRLLFSCDSENNFGLMTSTFSSFKDLKFSLNESLSGKGSLKGILMKNYREQDPVIVLNTYEDIDFTDTDRCDPIVLTELFNEDFNNFSDWTNYSVTGNQTWQSDSTHGNPDYCAKMSGHVGGASGTDYENEDWLITPVIDLSGSTNTVLTFQTASNYSGPDLEVFVSNDYTPGNNPNTATWSTVSADFSSGGWTWTDSGEIDLSSYDGGNVYIGFKYTSTTSDAATHEIDNVIVGYLE